MTRLLKIIGITGGSGAGKGLVCETLKRLGAKVINCDAIGHDVLLRGNEAYDEVVSAFGAGVLGAGGEIDRGALGKIVFASDTKRRVLMDITHRYIMERVATELADTQREAGGHTMICIDAPQLIEANAHGFCDQVWLVTAGEDTRLARIIKRDGISEAAAKRRIAAQLPFEEMARYADVVIENDGTAEALAARVERLAGDVG